MCMNELTELTACEALYLDLLKKCLTRTLMPERYTQICAGSGRFRRTLWRPVARLLASRRLELVRVVSAQNLEKRVDGRDWPSDAETMIGLARLDNLQECTLSVLSDGVPGDLIETGVWRGGACILMRAILKVKSETRRVVWVADSFQGLPRPDSHRYPADAADHHWMHSPLAVDLEQVRANFSKYGLLDDQVRFLAGWFRDTLPTAPIERLAVLRMDGDMYESTMDALTNLYPKLSVGGYAIADDYGAVPGCRTAVDEYRSRHNIGEELHRIDWTGVFWRRAT